ncbi:VTT domain-containing protein [Sphingomonas sp. HF-S3]|uniref:TVP38/TMEM64 family membrane protein n=1 Tax=Sphingomonas rustica TaxID=3103142 RepID=A0ABV0BCC6_9SPHN
MTRKIWILLAAATVAGAVFALGLHKLVSFDTLKSNHAALIASYRADPLPFALGFVLLLASALALCIPGSLATLGIAGGAIFGLALGAPLVLLGVVLGDSIAFLLARYLLRDWVRARFGAQFDRIDRGFNRHGALYLLSLRLAAIIPFFVVNLTMGLTRMRLAVFAPVSFVGLVPATLLHVAIGTELGELSDPGDILSWPLLLAFVALGLSPLFFRFVLGRRLFADQRSSADNPIAIAPIGPAISPNPGGPTAIPSPPNAP